MGEDSIAGHVEKIAFALCVVGALALDKLRDLHSDGLLTDYDLLVELEEKYEEALADLDDLDGMTGFVRHFGIN